LTPGGRRRPSAACGAASPKREIGYSSDSPGPPSLHSRFGDGLDGRRQIGSTPAAGDVRSADTPRAPRQAPPTNEPDEPRGPVLGERTWLFLATERETALPDAGSSSRYRLPPQGGAPARGPAAPATRIVSDGPLYSRRPAPCRPRARFESPSREDRQWPDAEKDRHFYCCQTVTRGARALLRR
jgi:hypothetical protein